MATPSGDPAAAALEPMLTPAFDPARPDLCVIGAGTAGHALALAAAALGLRCTVVDPRARLGAGQAGDLWDALAFEAAARLGTGGPGDWLALGRRAGRAIARAAPDYAEARLRTLGIAVVNAAPRFEDGRTLRAGPLAIRARRFVLATGAACNEPALSSASTAGSLTPGALAAAPLPERIEVLTERPLGLEWAQALARFGADVTLVATPGAWAGLDPELRAFAVAGLRRDGVAVHLDADPAAWSAAGSGGPARLLFGAGRPATAGLELGRARIALDERGSPVVDGRLRTTNARILALGDVLGRSTRDGTEAQIGVVLQAVVAGLPGAGASAPTSLLLRTVPPVAQVGTLDAARLWRAPVATSTSPGLVKLATDRRDRVVGAGLVGPGALDAIGAAALAVAQRLPARALARLAASGPVSEALRRAGVAAVADRLRQPSVKRLIALRQRLP